MSHPRPPRTPRWQIFIRFQLKGSISQQQIHCIPTIHRGPSRQPLITSPIAQNNKHMWNVTFDNYEFDGTSGSSALSVIDDENESTRTSNNGTFYRPIIPSILSLAGSSLIIYIIIMSSHRLSTSYHRIMFGLSTANIFASVAMGVTTLPMPTRDSKLYYWQDGTRLGNSWTCSLQGFALISGSMGGFLYIVSLCLYVVSAIIFSVKDDRGVKRQVEPILHVVPICAALVVASLPLHLEMYNESEISPWCAIESLPSNCDNDEVPCVRGSPRGYLQSLTVSLAVIIAIGSTVIASCIFMLWRKVYKQKQKLASYTSLIEDVGNANSYANERLLEMHLRYALTKCASVQALGYTMVLFLTSAIPMLNALNITLFNDDKYHLFKQLDLICRPLQGFFNFCIFIFCKVSRSRRERTITIGDAIKELCLYQQGLDGGTGTVTTYTDEGLHIHSDIEPNVSFPLPVPTSEDGTMSFVSSLSGSGEGENHGIHRRGKFYCVHTFSERVSNLGESFDIISTAATNDGCSIRENVDSMRSFSRHEFHEGDESEKC